MSDIDFVTVPHAAADGTTVCKICGDPDEDLRFGVCFDCADYAMSNGKEAWDKRKPEVRWPVDNRH